MTQTHPTIESIPDVQAYTDDRHIEINRVGIRDIRHPVSVIDRSGEVQNTIARFSMSVRLPDDLDWAGGSGALARHPDFSQTNCPRCSGPARRETDTLDCYFDDIWCFLQGLVVSGEPPGFSRENLLRWMPADLCQCGFDTASYFNLYRLLGRFLAERGLIDDPETIPTWVPESPRAAVGSMATQTSNTVALNLRPNIVSIWMHRTAVGLSIYWNTGSYSFPECSALHSL